MADTLHARLLDEVDGYLALVIASVGDPLMALRAVVEHHTPELFGGVWACLACSPGMPPQILIPAPCSTIQVIADALGVTDQELNEENVT